MCQNQSEKVTILTVKFGVPTTSVCLYPCLSVVASVVESVGQKLLTAFHLADITVHSFVPVLSFEGIKAFLREVSFHRVPNFSSVPFLVSPS